MGSAAKSNSRLCFTFVNVTTPTAPRIVLPTKFAAAEKHTACLPLAKITPIIAGRKGFFVMQRPNLPGMTSMVIGDVSLDWVPTCEESYFPVAASTEVGRNRIREPFRTVSHRSCACECPRVLELSRSQLSLTPPNPESSPPGIAANVRAFPLFPRPQCPDLSGPVVHLECPFPDRAV